MVLTARTGDLKLSSVRLVRSVVRSRLPVLYPPASCVQKLRKHTAPLATCAVSRSPGVLTWRVKSKPQRSFSKFGAAAQRIVGSAGRASPTLSGSSTCVAAAAGSADSDSAVSGSDNKPTATWLRFLFVLAYVAHVTCNAVSAVGVFGAPVNVVSAKYPTLLTPAGWTFSIWGLIFLLQGLGALTWLIKGPSTAQEFESVDQAARRAAPLWAVGWLCQSAWLVLFARESLALCFVALLGATAAFQTALLKLRACNITTDQGTITAVMPHVVYWGWSVPTSINAAWLTVATAIGGAMVAGRAGLQLSPPAAVLVLVLLIVGNGLVEMPTRGGEAPGGGAKQQRPWPNVAYSLTLAWALQGIAAHTSEALISRACEVGTAAVLLGATVAAGGAVWRAAFGEAARLRRLPAAPGLFSNCLKGQSKAAVVDEVYDGDTITVRMFLGPQPYTWKIRMNGYDSPELRTSNELESKAGYAVRDYTRALLLDKTVRLQCDSLDKYGRLLATVYLPNGMDVNQHIISKGFGKSYDGGTKDLFSDEDLKTILKDLPEHADAKVKQKSK